ncbi:myosin-2 heavy chain-like [Lingula anatina]|uniref:Myosin-2 heavy chain-like n=1 Tax=Lingula anatina TaxID=7574 RepID=A0A1S3J1J1_LINAN|nr:myosin-2 heavy chain-like [Lingula anatina]|eukprot:XP_013404128.1 myosin-2 heavy chain-like [Lingula anatina]
MSLKAEVPGIRLAIDHLQELGERMQNEDYGFKENDVENIDSIIEALGELEAERDKLHELLEIETIQASVLRHKLQVYPGKIKGEIEAAVKSARQSNADEVQRLQSQLEKVTKNIEFLELKLQELEEENAKLLPERDGMRKKHEEIIATLNVRLAEKATNQISLNETRDQLRATNQNIVNLEENILILKEDMIQERADARMEKKRLKKAVYDTTMKVREQRDANIVKKKELDALLEKLAESEGQLDMIRKSIRRYDTSRAKLEGQERALMAQLNREIKQNQELKQKRIEIEEESNRQQKEFEESKAALEGKLEELEVEIQKQSKKFERLDGQKMILEMDVEDAMEQRRKDAQNVEEINGILQAAKITLAKKAEETGRLTNENVYMEEAIVKLKETHELVVATLNKQIEEYRDQLSKERAER